MSRNKKKSTFIFASIDNAKFSIKVDTKFASYGEKFKLDDVDGMASFLKQFRKADVYGSSSIDFPEEDGAPENYDAHECLQQAIQLAWHTPTYRKKIWKIIL